uniref:GST N-terminal domain-containing protein n=1 Tax=Otus sunia TaxID=257818 RepID=A0A8C8AGX9_9STRI
WRHPKGFWGGGGLGRGGLAHAIRLLLEYTETPYEDKLYSCGEAPDYDKSQWINEKEKLGLDFPNVGGLEPGGWSWGWMWIWGWAWIWSWT